MSEDRTQAEADDETTHRKARVEKVFSLTFSANRIFVFTLDEQRMRSRRRGQHEKRVRILQP